MDQNYLQQARHKLTILLEYLIFLPVIVHCRCVGQQNVMCSKIWLWWGGGIPSYTRGTPSGWKYSDSVSQRHKQICLIHCRPVFNPITEFPEANLCIGFEVLASHGKEKKKYSANIQLQESKTQHMSSTLPYFCSVILLSQRVY